MNILNGTHIQVHENQQRHMLNTLETIFQHLVKTMLHTKLHQEGRDDKGP